MSKSVDRNFVQHVGGQVMAAQLAGQRNPGGMASDHLDRLADMSVRAAFALDAAIPRVEEQLAAEAKAAEEAAALAAQEKATAEKAAGDTARPTAALQRRPPPMPPLRRSGTIPARARHR